MPSPSWLWLAWRVSSADSSCRWNSYPTSTGHSGHFGNGVSDNACECEPAGPARRRGGPEARGVGVAQGQPRALHRRVTLRGRYRACVYCVRNLMPNISSNNNSTLPLHSKHQDVRPNIAHQNTQSSGSWLILTSSNFKFEFFKNQLHFIGERDRII